MPRRARVVLPDIAHHVVQRGNYQQNVFETRKDFQTYLYLTAEHSVKAGVTIHAFCLMHNHVHFILSPHQRAGLSVLFREVNTRFSRYKNSQTEKLGHLWQGRFFSCLLDEGHLMRAIRYVEMNPVRAGMVQKPWDYPWSSARQHLKIECDPIVTTCCHEYFREIGLSHENWKKYLLEDDSEMIKTMRRNTPKGWGIGPDDFLSGIERDHAVVLRPRKMGRPKR